jgi:hypothetical protein
MPVFDPSRLKFQLTNDLMKLIRKDATEISKHISGGIEEITENLGGSTVGKKVNTSMDGSIANVIIKIPEDKIDEFTKGTDAVVKKVFKFGNWSDMEIK